MLHFKFKYYFLIFLIIGKTGYAQNSGFISSAKKMMFIFDKIHPSPFVPGDSTSAEVTDLFIRDIDLTGELLIQEDIDLLLKQKNQLFSNINTNDESYFRKALDIYTNAIKRTDSILDLITKSGIDFNSKDTLYYYPAGTKTYYSESFAIHKRRIRKILKLECFEKIYNSPDFDKMSEQDFLKKASEISPRIIQKQKREIDELKLNQNEFVKSTLLNCIAQRYDPHSNYFSAIQNQQFTDQISSQIESYGFNIDEDKNGNVILARIVPGGSAWQTNQINENDLLLSLKIGSFEYFSSDYEAYEMQEKLSQSTEKMINLTVKKLDGQIKNLMLVKQKTISVENMVKGYILQNGKDKLGYISLPSFYTDMSDELSAGCTDEVAKEIVKLERDSVEALILDLRNNGGGSMEEAASLAGIFIDEGPLFIFKLKDYKAQIIKDVNKGTLFNKPVIVLINELSASASELFSNIIKDYNLGLVVGQKSYGKGSAQIIYPLNSDAVYQQNQDNDEFVKITEGCFYRLDNSTHHAIGVIPDIILPETPIFSRYNEIKLPYELKPERISKKVHYNPYPKKDIESLKNLSSNRIKNSKAFAQYIYFTGSINNRIFSSFQIPLNFKDYKELKKSDEQLGNSLDSALKSEPHFVKCLNYSFNEGETEIEENMKEFDNELMHEIEEDIFIAETFRIVMDYLKL